MGAAGAVGESGSLHRPGKGCWAEGVVWHHNSQGQGKEGGWAWPEAWAGCAPLGPLRAAEHSLQVTALSPSLSNRELSYFLT